MRQFASSHQDVQADLVALGERFLLCDLIRVVGGAVTLSLVGSNDGSVFLAG